MAATDKPDAEPAKPAAAPASPAKATDVDRLARRGLGEGAPSAARTPVTSKMVRK